jgi:hypothetical protein
MRQDGMKRESFTEEKSGGPDSAKRARRFYSRGARKYPADYGRKFKA